MVRSRCRFAKWTSPASDLLKRPGHANRYLAGGSPERRLTGCARRAASQRHYRSYEARAGVGRYGPAPANPHQGTFRCLPTMTWLRRSFPSPAPFTQHQDRREELGPDNGVADDSGSANLVVRHLGHELRQTERGDDHRLLSQQPPRPQSLPRSAGQLRRPWCRPQMADDSAGQARPLGGAPTLCWAVPAPPEARPSLKTG